MEDELKKYEQQNKARLRNAVWPTTAIGTCISGACLANHSLNWWAGLAFASVMALCTTLIIMYQMRQEHGDWRLALSHGISLVASHCFIGLIALGVGYILTVYTAR